MYSQKAIYRINIIYKKINFIENIIKSKGSIIKALEDEQNSRASILMHLNEGVDLYIVEAVIENRLPIIKKSVEKILKDKNDIDDR